jgi:hypothetical protein
MALFDELLGAINNPNQQASPDQLGSILNTVQALGGQTGAADDVSQLLMSVVGSQVRQSLQNAGPQQAVSWVDQFGGMGANPSAVETVLGMAGQQQVVQEVISRTGLDPSMVQSMLPMLVPLALQLLKGGAASPGGGADAGNPLLNAFLDGDGDGDVDLGDMLGMAGQFLANR